MSRSAILGLSLLALSPARAVAIEELSFDDGRSLSVGALARSGITEVQGTKNPALSFEGAVLALNGQLDPALKLQLNVLAIPAGGVQILDAIAEIEPSTLFKVWAGLLLPASDRLSLTGPYFSALWDAPFVATYPGSPAGRAPGATLWGRLLDERLRYQVGAYAGLMGSPGPLASARVQVDLLDREPGYYSAGTYLGERQVLTLGIGGRTQQHGAGGTAAFSAGSIDLLAESRFGNWGVGTLEAALLYFDLGSAKNPALLSGAAGEVTAAWLLPGQLGPVRFQPAARWEGGRSGLGLRHDRVDLGINGLALGQSLRLSLEGSVDEAPARSYRAQLGVQVLL